jgi:hypothetical protein
MLTPSSPLTAPKQLLPKLSLDFTTATLDPRVTFTRSGNTATATNSIGAIVAVNANLPRFDYDPVTLVSRGLLIEESRTNLLLNSLIDGTSLATQSVTVTAATRTLSFYGTGEIVLSGAASATVTGTGAYPTRTTFTFTPSAGSLTLTAAGTVQFAQLELGSFATSFIPTAAAAVTRNADVASMTGANFSDWFSATEGTLVLQCDTLTVANPNNATLAAFLLNSSNNIRFWMWSGQPANLRFAVNASGASSADIPRAITANTPFKIVGSYKTNSFACSFNGGSPTTDTSGAVPSGLNAFYIGSLDTVNEPFNGRIAKIEYYDTRPTNAELQVVSSAAGYRSMIRSLINPVL